MGITNVMVWIEAKDEDMALEISEELSELFEAHVVRPGVRVRGITQERPVAACGLACEGPRRLQGTIEGEPATDIYVMTPTGERTGILQFLREDGNPKVGGRRVTIELDAGVGC